MRSFLNIAAGKIEPLDYVDNGSNALIQLDTMYNSFDDINVVETYFEMWLKNKGKFIGYTNKDAFDFLATFKFQFDNISLYRFLEHITKPDIQGFIYLLSTAVKIGGIVDVIVPNYKTLAEMIIDENLSDKVKHADWERHDTLLTYELLNEPSMPHASIWTPERLKYFFELEQRFKLEFMCPEFEFDGRNIYIRANFKRVK